MTIDDQLKYQAFALMEAAAIQGHSAHWDLTMQGGRGCLECIRSMRQRKEARLLWWLAEAELIEE
jgi:hypothetical protein